MCANQKCVTVSSPEKVLKPACGGTGGGGGGGAVRLAHSAAWEEVGGAPEVVGGGGGGPQRGSMAVASTNASSATSLPSSYRSRSAEISRFVTRLCCFPLLRLRCPSLPPRLLSLLSEKSLFSRNLDKVGKGPNLFRGGV